MKKFFLGFTSALLAITLMVYGYGKVAAKRSEKLPITAPITPPVSVSPSPTTVPSPSVSVSPSPTEVEPTHGPKNEEKTGKATGGVKGLMNGVAFRLSFNAQGTNPTMGNVNYNADNDVSFTGKVDQCYLQTGNQAAFAGTINNATDSNKYFLIQVSDNGEGKKAQADKVNVVLTSSVPNCVIAGSYSSTVDKGNLQVHN